MISARLNEVIALHDERRARLLADPRPKIGWLSVSTPEEILSAAGALPYRITGEARPHFPGASTMMHRNFCPYVLSSLEEVLDGEHDFAAGAVLVNACDPRRRMFDVWSHFDKARFIHMVDLPKLVTPESTRYFVGQLEELVTATEGRLGRRITDERLHEAILLYNRTRELLSELYELRRRGLAPVEGSQAIRLVKAAMSGLRVEYNRRLELLVDAVKGATPAEPRQRRYRVLLTGSYFDHTNVAEIFESNGAEVACEDVSTGVKYFEGRVDTEGNPIEALARHYLGKATCARMTDSEKRFAHVWQLVERYEVQAVVYFALKFCDNNLLSYALVKRRLNERGIPVMLLEAERVVENIEQLKTRVVAFLESQADHVAAC